MLRAVLSARGEWPSAETRQARQEVVGRLKALCARLGAELLPYGSYLLGTDNAGSDVDAVAVGPASLSREDFGPALTRLVTEQEGPAAARFVADAALPLVELSLDGVHFDVSYASRPEGVEPCPPTELLARYGERLDTPFFRSLNGWTDRRALLDCEGYEGSGAERFRTVLRAGVPGRVVVVGAGGLGVYARASRGHERGEWAARVLLRDVFRLAVASAHAGGGARAASAQYGAQRVALDSPDAAR